MSIDECYSLHAVYKSLGVMCSHALPFCYAIWIGLSVCNASSPPAATPSGAFERRTAAQPKNQMAHEFPGQDLTVLACTPSNPPHKIGTTRFNARTRYMTYTRER
jgi:hypothetical protein